MSEDTFFTIIILYVLLNLILFILYKFTSKIRILHKILSIIDNLIFILIVGYGFYRANPLFVIFVPCVLLIAYPLSWGLNKELSDDDVASVVILRSPFPWREESRKKNKSWICSFWDISILLFIRQLEKSITKLQIRQTGQSVLRFKRLVIRRAY